LPSNDVYDLKIQQDGTFWAATAKGIAVSRDKGKSWNQFGPKANFNAQTLAITAKGKVFVGTLNGLFTIGKETSFFSSDKTIWQRIAKGAPNLGNKIICLRVDKTGRLLVGSNRGLTTSNAINPQKWYGLGGETNINDILIDKFNRIIVATNNGLNISLDQGDSWITYKKEHGLASNRIHQIAVATDRTIWVSMGAAGIGLHD